MSLYVYRLKTTPLALAAGHPIKTPSVASSDGALGKKMDITSELRPNLTVDPVNGVAGGLSAAEFDALQAQVESDDFLYEWTDHQEYAVGSLNVEAAVDDMSKLPVQKYVNPGLVPVTTNLGSFGAGSDGNPGTLEQPYATFTKAWRSIPPVLRSFRNRIFMASGDDTSTLDADYRWPVAVGECSPLAVIGSKENAPGTTTMVVDAASTQFAYVPTVSPVVADDALRGMYLLNNTTGHRDKVKTNTTTLGVLTIFLCEDPLGGVVTPGDAFVVEHSITNLLSPQFGVPAFISNNSPGSCAGGFKDLNFASNGDPGFPLPLVGLNCFVAIEGCSFDGGVDGRGIFVIHSGSRMQGSLPAPWFGDLADNPFSDLRYSAQAYVHTSNPFGMSLDVFEQATPATFMVMDNVLLFAGDCSIIQMGVGDARNSAVIVLHNERLTVDNINWDGDLGGLATIDVNGSGEVRIGADSGPVDISNATGDALRVTGTTRVVTGDFTGTGNGGHGISLQQGADLTEKTAGTTVTGAGGELLVGAVTRAYAQTPFSENELQDLETGAAAAAAAANHITGLTGIEEQNIGDLIELDGLNAGTHLIIFVVDPTEVIVASTLAVEAGPLNWTLKSSRATGNRAA